MENVTYDQRNLNSSVYYEWCLDNLEKVKNGGLDRTSKISLINLSEKWSIERIEEYEPDLHEHIMKLVSEETVNLKNS